MFSWRLNVEARHSEARTYAVRLPRSAAGLSPAWPRGRYQVTAAWELADWFGFTRLRVPPRETTVLTIAPHPREFRPVPAPEHRRGPTRPRRTGRRAGEPLDIRHYVPGDDLRRLHWPLYAHSDSLFVRTAEAVPPPSGRQFIVLDLQAASEEALDFRLECLAGWLAALDAAAADWTVSVPAAGLTLRPGDAAALAGLSPAPLPPRVGDDWPETVTLLTGSETSAEPLTRELVRSRRRVRPLVVTAPPAPVEPAPWWRRP